MFAKHFLILALTISFCNQTIGRICQKRRYSKQSSFVCVCNSTYCDDTNFSPSKATEIVNIYTSTKADLRFNYSSTVKKFGLAYREKLVTITIVKDQQYQSIKGFGGALTDSASINMKSLSDNARKNLLSSYFSSAGIEYNLVRVPMASCDYSTREYTYLDSKDDFNLTTFGLEPEDVKYKIPLLKEIFSVASKNISLYASPWTAPAWMKTNNNEIGRGGLKGKPGDKYHKTWAKYFIKFFESYKQHGIDFWGFTVQNEPSNGLLIKSTWQSTGMTAAEQRDFIKLDLGPALNQSKFKDLKIMILDDQRLFMPSFIETVCNDPEAEKYVSGIGVHWYWNWLVSPYVMQMTHEKFPNKFMLATEACNKNNPIENLGSWEDGVKYSNDILDVLNNWGAGWVDWNMCLNLKGGPNWANNFDNSPIIVNATADEFYKQPMFYHMGHFSKFVKEGSHRIKATADDNTDLKFVAVKTSSGVYTMVLLNTSDQSKVVAVQNGNETFKVTLPADSIQTLTWI